VGAIDAAQTSECLHGRTTTRRTTIYPISAQLLPAWAGVKRIIAIERTGSRWQGKKSRRRLVDFHETHYYLSSKDWSASQFSDAIRGHWLIENRLHWVKDVTLNEDNCIHQGGNAPANWAMVRQFLVSIARMFGTNTLPQALRSMANQLENVSELLFCLSHQDKPVESCARSPANNPTPLVCSFDN
jgi:predicted transposase YbfD/YdcC